MRLVARDAARQVASKFANLLSSESVFIEQSQPLIRQKVLIPLLFSLLRAITRSIV